MIERMYTFSQDELEQIHQASMEILSSVGIAFYEPEAVELFKKHGAKADGVKVFIPESLIQKTLATAPPRFELTARDPAKSIPIGGPDFALVPGYGAPFIITPEGDQRAGTMEDYNNFCKLVQTSDHLDMNGFLMVEPSDIPKESAYLEMMLSNFLLCDKPLMGAPISRQTAAQAVEMAALAFGGKEAIQKHPVMLPVTSVIAPLRYSEEMAGAIIEFARAGQPVLTASLVMAGSSGPVTLAGLLAQQNAEILAGMALTQLVRPGVPFIYGSSSCPMDMKTGALAMGAPETMVIVAATAQMGQLYNLPTRGGGTQSDAHLADYQAGVEAALNLVTTIRSGINFVLHATGILDSYASMSFEKFILDDELCGMVKRMIRPVEVSEETLDLETIKKVGIGGQFLTQPKTFRLCRTEFFNPRVMIRQSRGGWAQEGRPDAARRAAVQLAERLESYSKPDIDPALEKDLKKYVEDRKKG